MIYTLLFTLIFSLSVHADVPEGHEFLNSNGAGFDKLRKCYSDLQFSNKSLNTSSRFLRNFDYTHTTPKPENFDDYKALVIPKKVGNKYVAYMFQPGLLSQYPYGDLQIPKKDGNSEPMAPIGNSCELEKNFPMRWDQPDYKYFAFQYDHPAFNKVVECSVWNIACKKRQNTSGFRMQLYTDANGSLNFCEDELKTADFGKRSSNTRKGWHVEKKPETLNSKQAMDIISDDLSSKISHAQLQMKNLMKAASEQPQKNQRVSMTDLMAAYRAASKNCKGYSSQLDQMLLSFEQELITYDPKLNQGDGSQVTPLPEESNQ